MIDEEKIGLMNFQKMDSSEYYPTYHEREEFKSEGWREISKTDDPNKKAWFFLYRVIWSHYWRAREEIEKNSKRKSLLKKIRGKKYYPGYILDIDHYTKHWLWANKGMLDEATIKATEYEPEENKYLPEGRTSYYFPELYNG